MGCCSSKESFRANLLYYDRGYKPNLHALQYAGEDFVIDKSNPPLIIPTKGFMVELGIQSLTLQDIKIELEQKDRFSFYYRNNFVVNGSTPIAHINYVGGSTNDPIVVSVQFNPISKMRDYRVIVRNKKFDTNFTVQATGSKSQLIRLMSNVIPDLAEARLKEIKNDDITRELLYMEDRLLIRNYKFGVIYRKEGQHSEEEMFSNVEGSPEFYEFLDTIGDKVRLKGFKGFDGELDVKNDTTGTHSYYTELNEIPVMFHVSTMLPHSEVNLQQIERKRHIGNDICVIIFQEGKTPFAPGIISSHYNHVYAVVQVLHSKRKRKRYRVAFASKKGVASHGPLIPKDGIFDADQLRHFLLTKLINSERAAYASPSFGVTRTRANLLREIQQKYL